MIRTGASVASYHLSLSTVSRSTGRSATAAVAYRAGERIEDSRTGLVHDYTRRSGVEHCALVLPVDAPSWASDRSQLWNAAEAAEVRKNSTVAREVLIALPAELSGDQRRDLALLFAGEISNRHGCAVDVAIHAPGREGDHRNHHAHLMLTTRRLGAGGFGAKTRELDERGSGAVDHWRTRWAEVQNAALERVGALARVDHRSFTARGVGDEPLPELSRGQYQVERRAERHAARAGRDYEPVTAAGRQRAAIVERRGLRAVIARGQAWVQARSGELYAGLSGLMQAFGVGVGRDRDREQAREQARAEELAREQAREREAARLQQEMLARIERQLEAVAEVARQREQQRLQEIEAQKQERGRRSPSQGLGRGRGR